MGRQALQRTSEGGGRIPLSTPRARARVVPPQPNPLRALGNQGTQHLPDANLLQAKRRAGGPNDPAEHEADRVAEQVMRMPAPGLGVPEVPCAQCTGAAAPCPACAAKRGHVVQRRVGDGGHPNRASVPHDFVAGLGLGRPLDARDRAFFEPRLRADLGDVRVHTGDAADRSAESIDANAYTIDRHVVFRAGRYDPSSTGGRRLLAHELAHVIQQRTPHTATPRIQRDGGEPKPGGAKKEGEPKKGDSKPAAKPPAWSRKLTGGPRLLDGKKASYQVFFDHILPPVPKGRKQLWQVVKRNQTILPDNCKLGTEMSYVVDIVDIGSRTKIDDNWAWLRHDDPCFALETNAATVGFDDGASDFAQQTNVEVTQRLAKEVLGKMTGPIGTYSGVYSFVKSGNCPKCKDKLKALQDKQKAPNGEALSIDGVGSWTS